MMSLNATKGVGPPEGSILRKEVQGRGARMGAGWRGSPQMAARSRTLTSRMPVSGMRVA